MQITNPAEVLEMSKEQLVEAYSQTCQELENIEAQKTAIKDALSDKIEGNGEVIGQYTVSKAKRISWQVKIEKARELGAVKEAIDTAILKKLHKQGIEIPHTVTEYIIIKEIVKKEK